MKNVKMTMFKDRTENNRKAYSIIKREWAAVKKYIQKKYIII